jgi:glycosyltransferase involved in cell wall biosynthesis
MPLDVDAFSAGRLVSRVQPPRILYAGNLVQSKGVDVLLRAAALLAGRGVDFRLKILGQGPEESELKRLASELKLGDRVVWSRFVTQSQMPGQYGASTVTVLPTRGSAEGLGLTLVEALLAGAAVVGTRAGGIPEVVRHEETGLIARDGDPGDLAHQIERLLLDASLRDRLTRAGKERVLHTYSPETAVRRFLDIYHAATGHQPLR